MPSLYDLERLFELEQRSREERMRHGQGASCVGGASVNRSPV